jgi:hypothetical protein|tara:strand:- start:752 stop:1360 length:609 start_codon:yes stop_codon:yes gene_type:complete
MWRFLVLPTALVLHDYLKSPIDRLYFQRPLRPLMGMRNTIIDLINWCSEYHVKDYPGLWLVKLHYDKIRREFKEVSKTAKAHLFHELDPWFDVNPNYYYYKVADFPILNDLIKQIPCVYHDTAVFAVMDGPMSIAPHRAETNIWLRYHITIESSGDCTLYTDKGPHEHREGEDFLFDHARIHSVDKRDTGRRVVLILDVKRF